ncbi:MAG TPA: MlaD family protein [Lacipirellulaceae bacterium]|nr:MlaD family protein [Lacipirellulaceae bacterium]
MNERQMQFRVGVIVFATLIIGVLLVSLNAPLPSGWLPWGHRTYEVGIKVDSAPGVDRNTPVRKNGILIGRVTSIEEQSDGILLRAEINSNRPLYPEYTPHIRTTVIGDATIDFEFDFKHKRLPQNEKSVPAGYVFNGVADESPFDAIAKFGTLKDDFADAAHSLNQAGREVGDLAKNLNDIIGDKSHKGRLDHLVDTTDRAMKQFENTMTAFNEIIGDLPPEGVEQSVARPPLQGQPPSVAPPFNGQPPAIGQPPIDQVPRNLAPPAGAQPVPTGAQPVPNGPEMRQRLRRALNELPDAIHEMRTTMDDFRVVLESANKNLKNLEGFTEPLGQKGVQFADALLKVVSGIDQLVADFTSITRAVNNPRGTIGQLLNDSKAYDNFNILMMNANTVLGDIHKLAFRLQPVVEDARIFMDKIAREPGRLVTGGLNPSSIK